MAFPTWVSETDTYDSTEDTVHDIAMPATVNVGDLLVAVISNDGGATIATPAGWEAKGSDVAPSSGCRLSVFDRVADGTEGGTTVNFQTSANERCGGRIFRYTGHSGVHTAVEATFAGDQSSTDGDPPNHVPSFGALDYAWIAATATSRGVTFQNAPTNYSNGSAFGSGADSNHVLAATGTRTLNAANEDPGAFNFNSSGGHVSATISIKPFLAVKQANYLMRIRRSLG